MHYQIRKNIERMVFMKKKILSFIGSSGVYADGKSSLSEDRKIPIEQEKTDTGTDTLKGDTNCDGTVDMADAVLIMQALASPNKYGLNGTADNHLTEQGEKNGDMDGDGLTVGDAQEIQYQLLGISSDSDTSAGSVRLDDKVRLQASEGMTTDEKFAAAEMKLGIEILKKGFDPTKPSRRFRYLQHLL